MEPLKKLTIPGLLERSVAAFPDHTALSFVSGSPITYREFGAAAERVSAFLYEQGIRPGDRVALLSESQPNWVISYFAITAMGAVVVPILPEFHHQEVQHILDHSESKAFLVSTRLQGILPKLTGQALTLAANVNTFEVLAPQGYGGSVLENTAPAPPPVDIKEDDLGAILYTSGTTGQSKGVMLSHKNVVYDAWATAEVVPVSDKERILSVLPLAHTYEATLGMLVPLMSGSAIYYLEKLPTAAVLLPAMQRIRPTMMLTVPLIIEKIYEARLLPQFKKSALSRFFYRLPMTRKMMHKIAGKKLHAAFGGALHFFGIGGAAVAPHVELFLYESGFPYVIGYGLTETSPLISTLGKTRRKYRSIGRALPGMEIKIHDANPQNGEGEIWVKTPSMMKGYYKNPELTKEVVTEDGWLRTGDLGLLDKEGDLCIKGRIKNVILGPSGENIYPEEIEAKINAFDYVLESLVLPYKGKLIARVHLDYERLKEQFVGIQFATPDFQGRITELTSELREKVNAELNRFSRISEIIEELEPFEKTPTKKIKRYLYQS